MSGSCFYSEDERRAKRRENDYWASSKKATEASSIRPPRTE